MGAVLIAACVEVYGPLCNPPSGLYDFHLSFLLLYGAHPPILEKGLAHNDAAIAMGHPKSVDNDEADQAGERAANDLTLPPWSPESSQHANPFLKFSMPLLSR